MGGTSSPNSGGVPRRLKQPLQVNSSSCLTLSLIRSLQQGHTVEISYKGNSPSKASAVVPNQKPVNNFFIILSLRKWLMPLPYFLMTDVLLCLSLQLECCKHLWSHIRFVLRLLVLILFPNHTVFLQIF